jgi:glycerol-3-phosphate acyltransferase PlsX
VAVDAMGGDRAPGEIVAGARQVAEQTGIKVVLVGRPGEMGDTGDLPVVPASEVIGMDDDPGHGVRRMKDSSLVRAAEAVRDGKAMAMVSAGNTGAAMAAALLRMGRLPSVIRPAIATPIPNPGGPWPTVLLDAGANAECTAQMLVQFAQMGAAFARKRYSVKQPRVALLSIGEEKSKGSPLEKETHALLAEGAGGKGFDFVGNVEGRDFFEGIADVIVTDGFTGNVALKTLEGSMRFLIGALTGILSLPELQQAADALYPHLLPLAGELDP